MNEKPKPNHSKEWLIKNHLYFNSTYPRGSFSDLENQTPSELERIWQTQGKSTIKKIQAYLWTLTCER